MNLFFNMKYDEKILKYGKIKAGQNVWKGAFDALMMLFLF